MKMISIFIHYYINNWDDFLDILQTLIGNFTNLKGKGNVPQAISKITGISINHLE